jgi:outer membrane protein OmpA-like peptidoglycan-associated protein
MIRNLVAATMATVIVAGLSGCGISPLVGPNISARETGHGLELALGPALFDYDTAELGADGRQEVVRIARLLRQKPGQQIVIEGHTDSEGPDDYNLALSEQRAATVRNALIDEGVQGDRLHVVGLGEALPAAFNTTEDGRANNRRVEVIIR